MNKFLDYALLLSALSISCVAAIFSIAGLTAIFSGAFIPVVIMGSTLEAGKVILILWLHSAWSRTRILLRIYLVSAIVILSTITSMGIFGFLSKAHVAQSVTGEEIQSKIVILDQQITSLASVKTSDENTLKQLDSAITQVISGSTNETGAVKALQIRNGQQKERLEINNDIRAKQNAIDDLRLQESPLQLQQKKNAVDVGPIRYIAEMLYGDDPSQNLLDKAVRAMILLLVGVFDPLAIAMLLAFDLHKNGKKPRRKTKYGRIDTGSLISDLQDESISIDDLSEEERKAVEKELLKRVR